MRFTPQGARLCPFKKRKEEQKEEWKKKWRDEEEGEGEEKGEGEEEGECACVSGMLRIPWAVPGRIFFLLKWHGYRFAGGRLNGWMDGWMEREMSVGMGGRMKDGRRYGQG